VGFGCLITDTNFHYLDGVCTPKPVTIGERVWLGANVVVLPGATIGDDAVVAAGSIVTGELPSGMLSMGSPARPVREVTWSP
jgi:acetyltransferase-like isoleucine patch superfamily enzyme